MEDLKEKIKELILEREDLLKKNSEAQVELQEFQMTAQDDIESRVDDEIEFAKMFIVMKGFEERLAAIGTEIIDLVRNMPEESGCGGGCEDCKCGEDKEDQSSETEA